MPELDFTPRRARWGNQEVVGLSTIQLSYGGLLDCEPHGAAPIHLIRCAARGTPGPLLCGLDQHTLPIGFSVGGGSHTPRLGDADPATSPCQTCVAVAARMSLAAGLLSVEGSVGGDRAFRAVLAELERMGGLELARHTAEALAAATPTYDAVDVLGLSVDDDIELDVIASNDGWEWCRATVLATEPLRVRWADGTEKSWRHGARIPRMRRRVAERVGSGS